MHVLKILQNSDLFQFFKHFSSRLSSFLQLFLCKASVSAVTYLFDFSHPLDTCLICLISFGFKIVFS